MEDRIDIDVMDHGNRRMFIFRRGGEHFARVHNAQGLTLWWGRTKQYGWTSPVQHCFANVKAAVRFAITSEVDEAALAQREPRKSCCFGGAKESDHG
jgi:hypothetical protein